MTGLDDGLLLTVCLWYPVLSRCLHALVDLNHSEKITRLRGEFWSDAAR